MNIAYETTKIKKSPSEDAAKVGSWIIAPSWLGFFFGSFMFGGIAGAGTFAGFPFVFSVLMFGGGLVGLLVLLSRIVTYDKRPYIVENTTTPIMFEEDEEQHAPLRYKGNVQTKGNVTVEHGQHKYEFTSEQIRLMIDRVEQDDYTLAQNPLKFKPGKDYQTAAHVMENLGYWDVTRKRGKITQIVWLDDGLGWLSQQTRQAPPTG